VRGLGSVLTGGPSVIHHCVGRTGSYNKVKIGHWWILPLTNDEHLALHGGETFGYDTRKEFEKWQFNLVVNLLYPHPDTPSDEVCESIQDYRR